jgi:hypothetical protein
VYPVRDIHQIEITSRCNLRCRYCPSPHLQRPKIDMDDATFERALRWAVHFKRRGTQSEINLAGIGESTMHPKFIEYLAMTRKALGPEQRIILATNGLLVDDALAKAMALYKPMVWVSLHRPEKAGPAVEALKKYNLLSGISADPSISSIDWAGQVKWHVSTTVKGQKCMWVKGGMAMVLSDGRITRCCLDADGSGVFAHVNDDLTKIGTSPWALCRNCHLDVGVPLDAVS